MIVTQKIPYKDGELRIGWASWDDGSLTSRSIKYAYKDASGKISRGAPELPFDILIDMLRLLTDQGELKFGRGTNEPSSLEETTIEVLREERQTLSSTLIVLQKLMADLPWANFAPVYDQIGNRYEGVKGEITKRLKI